MVIAALDTALFCVPDVLQGVKDMKPGSPQGLKHTPQGNEPQPLKAIRFSPVAGAVVVTGVTGAGTVGVTGAVVVTGAGTVGATMTGVTIVGGTMTGVVSAA